MSELKATPGPWEWYTSNSYRRLGTKDWHLEIMYAVKYADGVCSIGFRNPSDSHLIEAAPDLYAALDACNPVPGSTADRLRKLAMAKARGETE